MLKPPARRGLFKRLLSPVGLALLAALALGGYTAVTYLPALITSGASSPATLVVESTPPGAAVQVNGENTGRLTPTRVEGLLAGSQVTLTLSRKGYEERTETVQITEEELAQSPEIRRNIYLKRAKGRLRVTSDPVRAEVYLSNRYVGDTPLVLHNLDRDAKPVPILLRKTGFRDESARIEWGDETDVQRSFKLSKLGK